MKNQLLLIFTCLGFVSLSLAQESKERSNKTQTDKGKWFVTTDLASDFISDKTTTTFGFHKENSTWSLGLSGGYFIKKNFAITAGLAYKNSFSANIYSYNLGAKYYLKNNIFFSADVGGSNYNLKENHFILGDFDKSKLYTGINAGYAWFIGKYLSVEPSIRYQYDFDKFSPDGDLKLNLGLSVHF